MLLQLSDSSFVYYTVEHQYSKHHYCLRAPQIRVFQCDGVDLTPRIKELKLHCILFHNITYYAGGTIPWGSESAGDGAKPSCCDGKIEVLGFTTATLVRMIRFS